MFKRLLMGLMGTSMVVTVVSDAYALRVTGSGYGGKNSILASAILQQVQNASITLPAYEVFLFLQEVSIRCKNPAGHTSVGGPFHLDNIAVDDTDTITSAEVTKNGRAITEITFTDPELIAAVEAALGGSVCNQNFTADKIVVHAMQGSGTAFSCETGGNQDDPRDLVAPFIGPCAIADTVGKQCFVPGNLTLDQLFSNIQFDYDCTTLCDDPNTLCPQPPQELPFP